MSTIAARLLGLVVALTVGGWLAAETPPAVDPAERVLRDHAKFLNEVSDRRRLNSLFANEQSPLYGCPSGM